MNVIPVILAGGRGSRLQELSLDVPKPMIEVAGQPFLEWVLRFLERHGLERFVLATGFQSEVIERFAAAREGGRREIACVREDSPLGTGGAFLHAAAKMREVFAPEAWLVLNGDSLLLTNLAPLLEVAGDPGWEGALLAVEQERANRYGSLTVDDTGRLSAFHEKVSGAGLVNGGVYLLKDELIRTLPFDTSSSMEQELFPQFLSEGARLRVLAVEAPFIDIGTPRSLAAATEFIERNRKCFHSSSSGE